MITEWKDTNRQIATKNIDIDVMSQEIKSKREELKTLNEIVDFLGPFSVVITTFAFISWYNKTQKLQDQILSDQSSNVLIVSRCQSCGMFLADQNNYHAFSEEDKKSIYCRKCCLDGAFTEPELTLKEMAGNVKSRCQALKFSKIETWIFVNRLATLERWKQKFNW